MAGDQNPGIVPDVPRQRKLGRASEIGISRSAVCVSNEHAGGILKTRLKCLQVSCVIRKPLYMEKTTNEGVKREMRSPFDRLRG